MADVAAKDGSQVCMSWCVLSAKVILALHYSGDSGESSGTANQPGTHSIGGWQN